MIAGIDGGGTSTRLEVRNEENQPVKRLQFGPFNVATVGEAGVRQVIGEIAAEIPLAEVSRFCIGCAAASYQGLRALLLDEMGRHGFAGSLLLCDDASIALRGAVTGTGGILIAGTGSVALGKAADGSRVRVGGWGHRIDDLGSGYAIGRDALAAAVQTEDGRRDADALHAAILRETGAKDAFGILDYVYFSGRDKSSVAALARVVLDCAGAGDEASLAILDANAGCLADMLRALAARLGEERPRVALLGGLLANDTLYGRIVRRKAAPLCRVTEPEHDALWGAAQMAWEMN